MEPWQARGNRRRQCQQCAVTRDTEVEKSEAGSQEGRHRRSDEARHRPVRAPEEGRHEIVLASDAFVTDARNRHLLMLCRAHLRRGPCGSVLRRIWGNVQSANAGIRPA